MAIAFDNSAGAASLSTNFTIGGGTNRLLLAFCTAHATGGGNITGCTYNGTSMTAVSTQTETGGSVKYEARMFYLLESSLPAAGTYSCEFSYSASDTGRTIGVASFTGVKQQPYEASNKTTGSNSASTLSITTITDNALIFDGLLKNRNGAITPDGAQTQTSDVASGTFEAGATSYKIYATAEATSMIESWSGSYDFHHWATAWEKAVDAITFVPMCLNII